MTQLAIKGDLERGKEVIEILEMLGGKNINYHIGTNKDSFYFIDDNNVIDLYYLDIPTNYTIFSLKEFLEKFPYKVGDEVQHKGATSCGSVFEVEKLLWEDNQVKYIINRLWFNNDKTKVTSKDLQPYEETMEEKLEQIILEIPAGYEFFGINDDNKVVLTKKQLKYPQTYKECCDVLGLCTMDNDAKGYKGMLIIRFQELLIDRDAYWKIAGEEMGLEKPWEPDWSSCEDKFCITIFKNKQTFDESQYISRILAFPTEEMRDTFYENFKNEIEQSKELL